MAARLLAIQDGLRARVDVVGGDVDVAEPLTAPEVDVLRHLRTPVSRTDIGRERNVSATTVKTHTGAVYRKLGAHSRAEAVRLGRESALI